MPDHPREFALEALMGMLPGEFEQVVFLYDIPKTHMPTGVSQTEQSITLIKYAEQREGGNLEHLRQIIDKVQGWTKQNNAPRGNHHG